MAQHFKSLEEMHQAHAALLARVEAAAARLDRRTRKLRALESTMAELDRGIAQLRGHGDERPARPPIDRRAQLIFNPASGRDEQDASQRLGRIVRGLRAHGIEAAVGLRTSGGIARALAREAVSVGLPLVVVAAGDSTLGDVASQLMGSSTVLGVVPIGKRNNIARSLGIPLDIEAACALIGTGTTRRIDLARLSTQAGSRDEYFLEGAGIGPATFGAPAGQSLEKRRWWTIPPTLERFLGARPRRMRIDLDGTELEVSTRVVTVSNAPLLGDNMLVAPDAKMDDGYLEVSVYDGMGDTALAGHFIAASAHAPDSLKVYRARRIRITIDSALLEHSGATIAPESSVVEIDVVPNALTMIVGDGIALSMPVASARKAAVPAPDPSVEAPPTNGVAHRLRSDEPQSIP